MAHVSGEDLKIAVHKIKDLGGIFSRSAFFPI